MGTHSLPYDESGQPLLEISVSHIRKDEHGGKPVELRGLIDSGASISAINKEIARREGLPVIDIHSGSEAIETSGGPVEAMSYICNLQIKILDREFLRVEVVGMEHIKDNKMIIGRNILEELIVTLDGPAQNLTITDPKQSKS